ncbi:MAG: translocation/assembly module TamB [Lentimicrobiaceae bacterium]|nr:translocation/assembly module TamB [Lentimicrobiaceae bacterium]
MIILVVIIGFFSSLITAVRDQAVQNFLARTAAGFLSNKMGVDIQIGSFFFDHFLSLYLKKIKVYDQKNNPLLIADEITVNVALADVLKELHLKSLILQNVYFNLIKYDSEENLNLKFLIDFFSSDENEEKQESEVYPIKLDDLDIENGNFRYWDQNKDIPEKGSMDYAHLNIKNINLNLENFKMQGDSMSANIVRLSASDTSGFFLERFSTPNLFVSSKGVYAENLTIVTPQSSIRLDFEMKYNNWRAYTEFVDSVYMKAVIKPSSFYLADVGYFAPVMFSMTDMLSISGIFEGYTRDFKATNFSFSFGEATAFHGDIAMTGLPDFFSTSIDLKINRMNFSVADLKQFALPINSRYIAVPQQLESFGTALIRGSYAGTYTNFSTKLNIDSEIGNLKTDLLMRRNVQTDEITYNGVLETKDLHVGKLIGMEKEIGKIDMNLVVDGKGFEKETLDVIADGAIHSIELLDNTFNDIVLEGNISNQLFNGDLKVDDEKLHFDFLGKIDFSETIPDMNFYMDVIHADLYHLNLLSNDSIMNLKSKIYVNLKGIQLNDMEGSMQIDSTLYVDSRGTYFMKQLKLDIQKDAFMSRTASIRSDFFDFDLGGLIDFNSFVSVFNSYIAYYVNIQGLNSKNNEDANHDFFVSLKLHHPNELTRLLIPSLHIADTTQFSGTFTSKSKQLKVTFQSDAITFSGIRFENVLLRTDSDRQKANAFFRVRNVVLRDSTEKDSTYIALQNPALTLGLQNDSIITRITWGDRSDQKNKGDMRAVFVPNSDYGGRFNFYSSTILVNDSVWSIPFNNRILFNKNQTLIENFNVFQGKQALKIEGAIPYYSQDTLDVVFENWDLSNFDLFLSETGINLDGEISGDLQITNLKNNPTFFSNLYTKTLAINKELLGDAKIFCNWNNENESIYLNTQFINVGDVGLSRTLNLTGYYFPNQKKDNINCELELNNFLLKPINPFLKGLLSRVEGIASGKLNLKGTFDKPILSGHIDLYRVGFKIDYLNTFYSLQHGFDFTKDKIAIDQLVLRDTIGNTAVVNGTVTHNHLRNFSFNVAIEPNKFLTLNTTRQMNNVFYGTAVASGKVNITGPLDNINLIINAKTDEGTKIFIPLDNTSTVSDKDFIVFVDSNPEQDTTLLVERYHKVKSSTNFNLGLNINVNPNADVKIFLPSNMGTLEARGSGNLRMGVNSIGDFTLLGDYIIQNGEFNFSLENLVRRRFDLMDGGKISWTGNPVDATIDVSGRYRLKTSLASLGIAIDSTSSKQSRVNFDCIIRLQNQLMNPDISFSIRMPQIDDDTRQQVYALLDTTNQSLMTQQMISLLVLGSFSYLGGSNVNVGSSYFSVITNQLSDWLSQISKDFDIGLHYKPGDELTNEEIEVALSTQLFDDRLTIEGNFGMVSDRRATAQNASNIVGDVDISFKITRDGRLSARAFNHSNVNTSYYNFTFDNYSPFTQGIGLTYRKDFDRFDELFQRKDKKKTSKKETR